MADSPSDWRPLQTRYALTHYDLNQQIVLEDGEWVRLFVSQLPAPGT